MKSVFTRSLSLVLSLILLISCLAACAEGGDNADGTQTTPETAVDETEAETYDRAHTPDNLPDDLDFGGEVLRIAHGHNHITQLKPDDNGDQVSDVIHERNVIVSERLHVDYEIIDCGGFDEMASTLSRSIKAGSDDYDVTFEYQWKMLPQVLEHMFIDLWDIDYIDLNQPWWNNEYTDELKIGDTTYYALTGDVNLSCFWETVTICFNKTLMQHYNVDPESIYRMVLDGKWTYDEYLPLCDMAYADLNGNGKRDMNDQYGLITYYEPDYWVYTSGIRMYTRDGDGYPVLDPDIAHFTEVMELLMDMLYHHESVMIGESQFHDGKQLFCQEFIGTIPNFRDMTDEYGVIPFPKWDLNQQSYEAFVHDGVVLIGIPTTAKAEKAGMAAAVMEAMSAQSYRTVIPAYYDVALKYKYVSDSASGIIIDMIKNAARTDFVYANNYALNNAGLICRTMSMNKSANVASEWKKVSRGAERNLKRIIEQYVGK